jgi:MFS transporter, MHS family, proline/betaine transporter
MTSYIKNSDNLFSELPMLKSNIIANGQQKSGAYTEPGSPDRRLIVAAILGNTLEAYDFTVYSLFAVIIGANFFPSYTTFGQLMLTVATFGVGFVARPFGAAVMGVYADRSGRKAALTLTILLMAFGTFLIGVTPTFEQIGVAAPSIIVAARLIQGFSAGGELGAATTYLIESAPSTAKGQYASWQAASQSIAILLAGITGIIISSALDHEQLISWGWRIPFILGIMIAPVGFYMRRHLDETFDQNDRPSVENNPIRHLLDKYQIEMTLIIICFIGPIVSVYVIDNYMTTYYVTVLHLPVSTAMTTAVVAGVAGLGAALIGGRMTDHFGPGPVLIVPQVINALLIVPVFFIMINTSNQLLLFCSIGLLTFVRSASVAALFVHIAASFPAHIRTTGFCVTYAFAATVFGGSAQVVATWLIHYANSPIAPAWYLTGTVGLSLLASFILARRSAINPKVRNEMSSFTTHGNYELRDSRSIIES